VISDEDREKVRQNTDFLALVSETVELRQRGAQDFWGCCPFHHEKSPSFHINVATGLWKCFGCGAGGDVFEYVMKRENLDFPDAIRYLAERAGIELSEERSGRRGPKRNRLIDCMGEAEAFFSTMLLRGRGTGPASARTYLGGRGFGSAVCKRWKLGYAPGHGKLCAHLKEKGFTQEELLACDLALVRNGRLVDRFYERAMFPIHDEQGRTIAFGGRVLTDAKPKYLNTKETSIFHKGKHLFAFDRAKEGIAAKGVAIVCEGYTDVISLHEAGFTNAVAALGTSFSLDHVRTLSRFAKRIICMFDGDAAGQMAAERAIQFIDKTDADLRCVVLPDNLDPAEFLAAHQPQELQDILDAAVPLMDFVFEKRMVGLDLSSPGLRVRALKDMAKLLAPLKNSYVMDGYATQLADLLGTDIDETKRAIREAPYERQQAPAGEKNHAAEARAHERVRARADGHANAGRAEQRSGGTAPDPYDYVPQYDEAPVDVPYDYVPNEAAEPHPSHGYTQALSRDERRQIAAEYELLSMMAANPDALREYADRIASFAWSDERHESIAWAILATPAGTSPTEAVAAATRVSADAPRILASGELVSQEQMSFSEKVAFVLNTMELFSTRKKIREIRSKLRSQGSVVPDEEAIRLFQEATELQKNANELSKALSAAENS
jgi:DNA primase